MQFYCLIHTIDDDSNQNTTVRFSKKKKKKAGLMEIDVSEISSNKSVSDETKTYKES